MATIAAEKQRLADQILAIIKRNLRVGAGEDLSALSRNWWKNGFSHKLSRKRLLQAIIQNAVLFQDAVKAGKQLVKTGLIRVDEKPPKYIRRLLDLARDARRSGLYDFAEEFDRVKKHVRNLRGQIMTTPKGQRVELLTRAGKKNIVNAINKFARGGSEKQLNESLKKYAYKQAVYNARTLQRSATNDAFQTRVRTWSEDNEDLVQYVAWQLAPARNFTDICDDYAQTKFRHDEVPDYPHYN